MINNKKKSIKVATLILISLLFFSGISTATSISITESSNEEKTKIEDLVELEDEEYTTPSYETTETDWRPIEESLNFNSINAESAVDPTITVSYDTSTGVESFISSPESSNSDWMPSPSVIEEYQGMLAEAANDDINNAQNNPESVIGTDGRTRITPTTSFPWRTVVKLYITAADASTWVGSGAMVDEFHVLTAGHCVHIDDHGGWVSSIRVVPAMDDLDDPYGEAWDVAPLRSYTGWTVSQMPEHDWGLIRLDRNVGSYIGWMGRMSQSSGSAIYTQTMNVAGYPADLDSGRNMYWDADAGDGATNNNHFYWADTAGGMSGGPVWRYVSGNRYILTVHAYGRAGTDSNFGTRLNTNKFNQLTTWLDGDPSPTDYADLEDRGSSYSSYNLGTVYAGQNFQVWSDVINKGTASSGSFTVSYYASTNPTISIFDYLLGTDTVSSISPFNYRDSSWSGAFPSIPNDDYYIGWIIDSGGVVTEFDETDNIAYILGYITKEDPPPGGYIEVTVNDDDTSLPLSYALVKCYNPSDVLISSGYTDSSGFYNITGLLDTGWYEINVSKNGYQKQSQMNFINWVGDDDYRTFNLVPYPPNSGWIDVTVKNADTSLPISSSYVAAHYLNGTFLKGGYTDGSGFYRVTGLGIGWWEIRASKTTYIDQSKNDYINWNGDDDYLTFYLAPYPPNSGWIEVQVNDSITHNPVGNALVETFYDNGTLFDSGFTNTTSGHYIVPDMPIGWYTVNVSKGGYVTQSKSNYINWRGDDDYLWYFMSASSSTTGVIEVEVFDSVSSLPMENALVECFYQNGTMFDSGATNAVGVYSVVDLPLGIYTVNVSKLTYATQSQQDTISAGGEFDHLTFNLVTLPPDSGYIEVQVNDSSTLLPLQNAFISCYYSNDTLFSTGYTDNSGFFKISGLTVGLWKVEASKVGYDLDTQFEFINWIGDDDYLYFYLDTIPIVPAYIEVQVNDSVSLNPIQNAYVQCLYSNGTLFDSGYTDISGLYNITGLDGGWWTVIVSYSGYIEQSQMHYLNWWAASTSLTFSLVIKYLPIIGPVAIFRDIIPWNMNATEPILRDYGIPYTVFDSSDVGVVDISSYQKVIIVSDQPPSFYTAIGNNIAWFENYAAAGGLLQIHAVDDGWETGDWSKLFLMPGGINKTQFYEWKVVSVNMSQHPVLLSPYPIEGVELDSWLGGYFITYPTSASVILSEPSSGKPVLLEFSYGSGHILASTHTLEWNQHENLSRLLENIILYNPLLAFDTINVTSPVGSSSWEVPTTHVITWDSTGTISNVKIDLYENGVFVMEIVGSTPNNGSYSWDIPNGLSNSTLYQIRVSDASYPLTNDDSDNFEIEDPRSITVVIPDSTTSWKVGDTEAINWTSTGIIANVKIDLYENGVFVMEIVGSTPNNGSYSWDIPIGLSNSTLYQIRVSDASYPLMNDDSDNFEIEDPRSITVVIPDSTTSWTMGDTEAISWTSTGIIANVKIDLYENGVFVMEIVASTPNDGAFSWDVPLGLSDSSLYTIRISDAIYPLINDESENFEILDLRSITVVVPDSTTSWTMGDTEAISWTSTGIIANVKIELYASGYLIMEIAASTPNDGTFDWTIPNTLINYTTYVIRISDTLDATIYDESDPFTITGVTVPPDGIPGYDLILLWGVLLGISFILVKTKKKKTTLL